MGLFAPISTESASNLTRFADNFIIAEKSKEILKNEVNPLVTEFPK
jgi:hypothetical protein